MKKSINGFTIVELLIVIVVIGILASISIISFNGIQERARYARFLTALDSYEKALTLYKTFNGAYPSSVHTVGGTTINTSCLGTGYPATSRYRLNECANFGWIDSTTIGSTSGLVNETLNQQLREFIPQPPHTGDVSGWTPLGLWVRGIWYDTNPAGPAPARIHYVMDTNRSCDRGTKIDNSHFYPDLEYTECVIYLN